MTSEWYRIRWEILERDKFTCRYCGQFAPNVTLEVDHVTAVADNGSDVLENLVTSCRACNRGKEMYRAWVELTVHKHNRATEAIRRKPVRRTLEQRILEELTQAGPQTYKALASKLDAKFDSIVKATIRSRLVRIERHPDKLSTISKA